MPSSLGGDSVNRTQSGSGVQVREMTGGALGHDGADREPVAPALATSRAVYAPDLRGHGESAHTGDYSLELMRDDVLGFVEALNLGPVTLVGALAGGMAAYCAAGHRPDRISLAGWRSGSRTAGSCPSTRAISSTRRGRPSSPGRHGVPGRVTGCCAPRRHGQPASAYIARWWLSICAAVSSAG